MKLSLRSRVLAATLALVVAGLAVAGVATYLFLRSFLLHRVDQELAAVPIGAAQYVLQEQFQYGHSDQGGPASAIPPGTYVALLDSSGHVLNRTTVAYPTSAYAPRLPGALPGSSGGKGDRAVFTAGDVVPGPSFRVDALPITLSSGSPGTLVIAIPFTEIEGTLHRLIVVEVLVSIAVLAGVGAVGWWLVRRGLRPLDDMAETADAITTGDLSLRVDPADEETEVGRLGLALNTMLDRIETSFEKQRASEERLRRFVADASHELRTPITSIRGYAELFRRGASARPDDLERAMRRIEDEGARMGVLVEDLLLLARLDQGRPLERAPVELGALVTDAVHDARAAAPDRDIALAVEGDATVSGDEMSLRQVMANLLDNAVRHTPSGSPVSVRLSHTDRDAGIEVADRGPGLPAEDADRIFERFYRGDPSRSRSSGGTGLGLSIASAVVEAHGGRISVTSRPGEGAIFAVSLPLQLQDQPVTAG